jgi:hypothetical protein
VLRFDAAKRETRHNEIIEIGATRRCGGQHAVVPTRTDGLCEYSQLYLHDGARKVAEDAFVLIVVVLLLRAAHTHDRCPLCNRVSVVLASSGSAVWRCTHAKGHAAPALASANGGGNADSSGRRTARRGHCAAPCLRIERRNQGRLVALLPHRLLVHLRKLRLPHRSPSHPKHRLGVQWLRRPLRIRGALRVCAKTSAVRSAQQVS